MRRSLWISAGLILVVVGALTLVATLGAPALYARRAADLWPLGLVAVGLGVLLNACRPASRSHQRPDGTAIGHERDEAMTRESDRIFTERATPAGSPAAFTEPASPMARLATTTPPAFNTSPLSATPVASERCQPVEPATSPTAVPTSPQGTPGSGVARVDLVAALLALQGLRRNGLISKREYRAKRAELVARMTPELLLRELGGTEADPFPGPGGRPATGRPYR